jgi:hypothetical protein
MISTASRSSLQRAVARLKKHAGAAGDERGFVLILTLGLLSVCVLIGMAAMNTSMDELEISKNEVWVRRTLTYAIGGTPLAALAIEQMNGEGNFPSDGCRLDAEKNPDATDPYYVTILDHAFLTEPVDMDSVTYTGWNNTDKYGFGGGLKANFKPVDDLKGTKDNCKNTASPGADIRVQKITDGNPVADSMFNMLVDIDKMGTKPDAGGCNSFGDDFDVILVFNMDSRATLPGRDLESADAPVNEIIAGYYFRPRTIK